MNTGAVNVNSATAEMNYLDHKRNYNLSNHITSTNLNESSKKDLLLELTGKHKTMVEGAVFMLKNETLKFDDFERALSLLNRANNAYSLTAVEAALQTQIDAIRNLNESVMSKDNKSLCLYTLQNMIFALSDYHLKNGKENDYVPKILQDQYQMLLKGSVNNLDWDKLNQSVYTNQFNNEANPTLAKWKFLDDKLVKRNMENMVRYQSIHDETLVKDFSTVKVEKATTNVNQGVVSWGTVELTKTTDAEINQVLNRALEKFNAKNLKSNVHELFNFVKDALTSQNSYENLSNYPVLHQVVALAMHRIVEIGNDQQKKTMMQQTVPTNINYQNQAEERSL